MRSEHDEQAAVIRWARQAEIIEPRLWLLHATPNAGKRSKGAGRYMCAEGLKAGVPDLFLPVGTVEAYGVPPGGGEAEWDGHLGLFIEMKQPGKKPTATQQAWIDALRKQGYRVEICYSADEAIRMLEYYLGMERRR